MERKAAVVARLKGPVVPLNLCFRPDGIVDLGAVASYVRWLGEQGVPVLLLTYGSSEFSSLSEADIWQLTEAVARANEGRALFVAATGFWPARRSAEFLRHAEQVGADAVKVQIHPFHPRTREFTLGYFDLLQEAGDLPLLLWDIAPQTLPVELVAELAGRPKIAGIKNDGDQFYHYYDLIRATAGKDFAVISGGQMRNFAFGFQVGSPAYLCPIAPFRPELALKFYEALVARRYDEAWAMVYRWEEPWLAAAVELGWLQSIKTALCLYGLYPNHLPCPPLPALSSAQVGRVRAVLEATFGPLPQG
ncbi:MAG: dihydrodipicolinate synthase family protein [Candidatus Handelsmanbacteria bacterium]|nr:dihydrodipicolinate synthase family protein [Candidatus Handelsmanbacteria bacterium]